MPGTPNLLMVLNLLARHGRLEVHTVGAGRRPVPVTSAAQAGSHIQLLLGTDPNPDVTVREARRQGMQKAVQVLEAQVMTPEAAGTRDALVAILVSHIEHFFPEAGAPSGLSKAIREVSTPAEKPK